MKKLLHLSQYIFSSTNHSYKNLKFSVMQWLGNKNDPEITIKRRVVDNSFIWNIPTVAPIGINQFIWNVSPYSVVGAPTQLLFICSISDAFTDKYTILPHANTKQNHGL